MLKKLRQANEAIENWFDKQNTNTTAQLFLDLIYEFSLVEDQPYSKVVTTYKRFEELDISLLRNKNRKAYEVVTNIINIIEDGIDISERLAEDLTNHKSFKSYYKNILQAYTKEVSQNVTKEKVKTIKKVY